MFGSLTLPSVAVAGAGTRIRTSGGGGGIDHHLSSSSSSMGSIPFYHPTMSLTPSRKLLPRRRTKRMRIRASSFTTAAAATADTLPRVELLSSKLNLYQILRIKQNASSLEIKTAYRKLAKQFHPDALPHPSKSSSSSSESSSSSSDGGARDFMEIHNAYATLSDPTERARYDLSIQIQSSNNNSNSHTRRYYSSSSSAVDGNEFNRSSYGMQTRRWETDQCW